MKNKFDDQDRGTQIHPSQALPHRTLEEHNRIAETTGQAAPTEKPREPVEGLFVQDLFRIARKWARGKDEHRGSNDFVFTKARFVKMMDEVAAATTAASAVPAELHDFLLNRIETSESFSGRSFESLKLGHNDVWMMRELIEKDRSAAPSAALSEKAEPADVRDAARYRFLRDRLAVEDLPPEHPAWSSPSEIESVKVDTEIDARIRALKSTTTKDQAASKGDA